MAEDRLLSAAPHQIEVDELRQGHATHFRALLEALPEFIFEAHAGAMAIDDNGTFDD